MPKSFKSLILVLVFEHRAKGHSEKRSGRADVLRPRRNSCPTIKSPKQTFPHSVGFGLVSHHLNVG